MSIREDFLPFWDSNGLLSPNGQPSGNGVLYTSEYYLILAQNGILTEGDKHDFYTKVKSCIHTSGCVDRGPNSSDGDQCDDYDGLLAACSVLGLPEISCQIIEFGDQFGWNFFCSNPKKWSVHSWLGRNLAFVAHAYFAAGKTPPLLVILGWSLNVFLSSRSTRQNQDSWILTYLLTQTQGWKNHWSCRQAVDVWSRKFKEIYPGGMNEVQASYLNNSNHPLARYWLD